MKTIYVDTSAIAALLLGEPAAAIVNEHLVDVDAVVSANLLEAELRSLAARERVEISDDVLRPIGWILPDRVLTGEIEQVLDAGYVRGADLWHLACALFFFESPTGATFLTLDLPQRAIAQTLGFEV